MDRLNASLANPIQSPMAEPLSKLYFLFDRDHGPRDRLLPRWLFLRALGLVYLSAFVAPLLPGPSA